MKDDRFKYRIEGIYHSGRLGTRWQEVSDLKYDGLVGCLCSFDPKEVEQFKGIRFFLKDHPYHSWWETTAVLQLAKDFDDNYVLETVNTIYMFKEVKE